MERVQRINGMLLGAFLGDALALGPHWIYDVGKIRALFGDLKGLTAPPVDSYHHGKSFGDWTHYGDQTKMLLEYLFRSRSFERVDFLDYYGVFMRTYAGYKDHATRDTLANLARGLAEGSVSDELGGTARMAAPLFYFAADKDRAVAAAVEQCRATHQNADLLAVTALLATVVMEALDGVSPLESLATLIPRQSDTIQQRYQAARALLDKEAEQAIPILGQMCSSKNAFPAVVYLLFKYKLDYSETLLKNAAAGGDSAARGMVLGAILGAWTGQPGLPEQMLRDMNGYPALLAYLDRTK